MQPKVLTTLLYSLLVRQYVEHSVAKLVKSFGRFVNAAESLDDFRYDSNPIENEWHMAIAVQLACSFPPKTCLDGGKSLGATERKPLRFAFRIASQIACTTT